jgi:DNA ligase-1
MTLFRPMLAETCKDASALTYPVVVSPKLDGIRCVILNGEPVTRKLKPIPNHYVRGMLSHLPPLDGEIMMRGEDGKLLPFDKVQSAVMRHEGAPEFEYHVFDWVMEGGFLERIEHLNAELPKLRETYPFLRRLRQYVVTTPVQLMRYEEQWVNDGFEGVMVRATHGPYKFGRSTVKEGYLLKIKRWHDMEAEVIGFVERMHNDNVAEVSELGLTKRSKKKAGMRPAGDLGALVLRTVNGQQFECGTGFTAQQRIDIWRERDAYLGLFATIKFQELTKDIVPRFPVFKSFRHPDDTGEPNGDKVTGTD